jgi:hypothetical protein
MKVGSHQIQLQLKSSKQESETSEIGQVRQCAPHKSLAAYVRLGQNETPALSASCQAPTSCGHAAARGYVRVTSSPDDKLTGDLDNMIEATQIDVRRSDRFMAGKLSPGNFGLQYLLNSEREYRP